MANLFLPILSLLFHATHILASCDGDNAYRALAKPSNYAFCSAVLATSGVDHATISTPANVATYRAARITSACSCVVTEFAPTTTAKSSSSKVLSSSSKVFSSVNTSSTSFAPSSSTPSSSNVSSSSFPLSSSSPNSQTSSSLPLFSSSSSSSSSPTFISSQPQSTSPSSQSSSQSSSTSKSTNQSPATTSSSPSPTFSSSPSSTTSSSEPSFTGVKILPYTGLAGCFSAQQPDSSLTEIPLNATGPPPYFYSAYTNDNRTFIQYLKAIGDDNVTYYHDVRDPNRYVIFDQDGNGVYIDSTGLHFFTPNCTLIVDVLIDNFNSQVGAFINQTVPSNSALAKRALFNGIKETPFTAITNLKDQCDLPVTDLTPTVSLGSSPCTLNPGLPAGSFLFNCLFPGENSKTALCEAGVGHLIDFLGGKAFGTGGGWALAWFAIKEGAKRFITPAAIAAAVLVAGLTLGPGVLVAIAGIAAIVEGGLSIYATLSLITGGLIAAFGADKLAQIICLPVLLDELPFSLTLSAGYTTVDIQDINDIPTSVITTDQQIEDPNQHYCCTNPGVCYTFTNCLHNGRCACGITGGGLSLCFYGEDDCTLYQSCESDAECASGACIISNCCGYGVCADGRLCVNLSAKRWDGGLFLQERNDTTYLTPVGRKV